LGKFQKVSETGDPTLIPELKPGDTIIVSGTIFYAISKVASFLSDITIALGVYNIVTGF
jgi:preprotein translocase subunit YajC